MSKATPPNDQHREKPKADHVQPQPERPMVSYPMPYRPSPNEPPPMEIKLPKRRPRRR